MAVCTFFIQSGVTTRVCATSSGAVFGFATLNILGLVARRLEPGRTRMTFGEVLAIGVAVMSILMLAWEVLF
jgi:hypothetical protein